MKISEDCVVSIHYTLSDGDGNKLDTSAGRDPLMYLHGAGNIVPGLEKALEGRTAGDNFQVKVEPADGYGQVNPELVQKVPRSAFQGPEPQAGMQYQAQGPEGQMLPIRVLSVDESTVTVDGNHPLAGETLHFNIDVVNVRKATDEEAQHGHVHPS